jgi:hypothetical protein
MAPLFRKSEKKIAEEAAVQAEIARIRTLSIEEVAVTLLPALGPDGIAPDRNLRPQQLCVYLLRDFPSAGQMKPLQVMARVRRALELLEEAELVSSMAYERSPVWRITDLGETALAEGTIAERLTKPA